MIIHRICGHFSLDLQSLLNHFVTRISQVWLKVYSSSLAYRNHTGVNVRAVYSLSPLPTELREQGLTRWDSRPVGLQVYTQIYASLTFAIP